jgi:ATP-dependent exoDNAse (exonuclease V) beta subunit
MLNMLLRALGWRGEKEELDTAAIAEALEGVMTVEEIPEVTEAQILGHSSFKAKREPADLVGDYVGAAAVERRFPRRDYTAVEFSGLPGEAGEAREAGEAGEAEEGADSGRLLPAFDCDRFLRREEEVRAFGTFVHARIEEALSDSALPARMPPVLAEKAAEEREALEAEAQRIAAGFLESELGRAAREGRCECELPFLLRLGDEEEYGEEAFVRGQIDLLLDEGERVTVCDFKTDRRREPEAHAGQLEVYRRAAAELYGKPVRAVLCYLRSLELAELPAGELPSPPGA